MAESYLEQLDEFIASGMLAWEFVNPQDEAQKTNALLVEPDDRQHFWPNDLPEPVILEGDRVSGIATIRDPEKQLMLLVYDRVEREMIAVPQGQFIDIATARLQSVYQRFSDIQGGYDEFLGIEVPEGLSDSLVIVEGGDFDGQVMRIVTLNEDSTIEAFGRTPIGDMRPEYLVAPEINIGEFARDAVRIDEAGAVRVQAYRHDVFDNEELGIYNEQVSDYLQALKATEDNRITFGHDLDQRGIEEAGVRFSNGSELMSTVGVVPENSLQPLP